MKNDIVTILAGAVLAFVAWKTLNKSSASGTPGVTAPLTFPRSINVGDTSGTIADGWQYFTDGTAIAPNGDYYYQGRLVYRGQA